MLLGGQRKRSRRDSDNDNGEINHSVPEIDLSPRRSSRYSSDSVLQRPPSPRLLLSKEGSTSISNTTELPQYLNFSGTEAASRLQGSSRYDERNASPSSTPKRSILKRIRARSNAFGVSKTGARLERPKTARNVSVDGNWGKDNNHDLKPKEKNDALSRRTNLNHPTYGDSVSPSFGSSVSSPQHTTTNKIFMQDSAKYSGEALPAASNNRQQLRWQQQHDDVNGKEEQQLKMEGNEMIGYRNEPNGPMRPNRRNVGRGGEEEGEENRDEHDIEIFARRLGKQRQKQQISRGNWSGGLSDQWRKEGKSILVLIVLGVCGSLIDAVIDTTIGYLNDLSGILVDTVAKSSRFTESVVYTLYMMLGTCIGVTLTALVAPDVAGSGLPLMKWLIGTDDVPRKLAERFTLKTGIVKVLGLSLGAGVGLNIGREGPFVHIAGILAYQLMSCFSWFHDILHNESLLRQVLVSSTSLGIGSTFAATIGGVLFTIEITSTYYLVAQYFKGFVAGVAGAVAVTTLSSIISRSQDAKEPFLETNFTYDSFEMWELPIFALLGVICGFFGPLYGQSKLLALHCCRYAGLWSNRNNPDVRLSFVLRSVGVGILVALISALLSFWPGHFNQLQPFDALDDLFQQGDLPHYWNSGIGGARLALLTSFVVRWITAVLSTSIVLPAGDFILTTVCGASFGRLCGSFIRTSNPGTYAFIGGAALSAAATQSVSSAVIVMELAGGYVLKLPTLLAVVVAVGVSRKLGKNIYDCIVDANELSSLQGLKIPDSAMSQVAHDMMASDVPVIPSLVTHGQIIDVLEKSSQRHYIPVVSRVEDMIFLGVVDKRDLVKLVHRQGQNNAYFMSHIRSHNINPELKNSVLVLDEPSWTITGAISDIWGSILPSRRSSTPETHDPTKSGSKKKLSRVTLRALEQVDWEETNLEDAILQQVLDEEIDLIHEDQEGYVYIDANAWSVPELLRATELYVVVGGQLRGVVTRGSFLDGILASQEPPVLSRMYSRSRSYHNSGSDLQLGV